MKTLLDHARTLKAAIARAVEEHGAPNSFSFGELHQFHGGPPPLLAGRAAKRVDGLRVKRGSVFVGSIICGICEHEWDGPADGACPKCGNDCEDHVVSAG